MTYKTFAAIDVGSYELAMKVYEISAKNGIKEIDHIRHRIELGTDSYFMGKLNYDRVDELCRMLNEFTAIMKSYKVDAYKAYGTSAIRESQNQYILLDQIETRTGIRIEVLSNSEQRFLNYKAIFRVLSRRAPLLSTSGAGASKFLSLMRTAWSHHRISDLVYCA